jgi:tetratricopeptide (TPR) repeat protein
VERINRFWRELKRRKVFRVLAMYAATAFIILEASDIMLPRLGLPDWTVTLVIVLIIVGIPVTAIVSWIFDITPEGLMKTAPLNERKEKEQKLQTRKRFLSANNIVITALIAAVVILAYPKVFDPEKAQIDRILEDKKVIAVLPFMNNTGDDDYDHWEYGISELMISSLSTSKELTVIDNQTITDVIQNVENIQAASIGPDIAKQVASRIQVKSYIYGNYLMAGSTFRINLKLIETKSNEVLKTVHVEGKIDSIFSMVDLLSNAIRDHLEITLIGEGSAFETTDYITTNSPEAYKYFIEGMEALWTGRGGPRGFIRALEIDSTFTHVYFFGSISLLSLDVFDMAKETMLKAYEGKDQLPEKMQLWLEAFMAQYIGKNPHRAINYFRQASEKDPLSRLNWYWIGSTYMQIEEYEEALHSFQQILKLNKKFGPWRNKLFYRDLSATYLQLNKYKKAQKILEEGALLLPDFFEISRSQAVCALLQNDMPNANQYIDQFRSAFRNIGNNYYKEAWITANVGRIYREAGQVERAEELLRQALEMRLAEGPTNDTLNPGNHLFWYYHLLGDLLIESEIHFDEGMNYLQKTMVLAGEIYPEYHPFLLHSLGAGYYKQGKYEEALQALNEADENMSMYDHTRYQLIQEVEKALASQN